eukprot:2423737-Rhodomonas_salina.1
MSPRGPSGPGTEWYRMDGTRRQYQECGAVRVSRSVVPGMVVKDTRSVKYAGTVGRSVLVMARSVVRLVRTGHSTGSWGQGKEKGEGEGANLGNPQGR